MDTSRRHFVGALLAGSLMADYSQSRANTSQNAQWHKEIALQARRLSTGQPLRLLVPKGSSANVIAATRQFTLISGVPCIVEEVGADDVNMKIILRSTSSHNTIDVALPATFGLIELVHAKAIVPLDDYADKYEPPEFSKGYLYRKGDHHLGKLYGYQTDGDAYLLFYNRKMLEDPAQDKAYRSLTGKSLEPATSWEDLDRMMAFFHRPDQAQYGGCLYRNAAYVVWEWWARFHAKGGLPFDADMQININNAQGIEALEELIAATASLSPNARANGLVDNWQEFSGGNIFCNIGWGGTQKFLMNQENMRDNVIHSALPGPLFQGEKTTMGYVNWGWNYTVSSLSSQPELAYLLTLFCASPKISTLSIREPDGFFDPFRQEHYEDDDIIDVYSNSFLTAHRESLINAIPDLYISGQSSYLDLLRQQIIAAIEGDLAASEALDDCAQKWSHLTRRLGSREQAQQWQNLLATYPANMRESASRDDPAR